MSEREEGSSPRLAMIKSSDNSCDDTQVQNQTNIRGLQGRRLQQHENHHKYIQHMKSYGGEVVGVGKQSCVPRKSSRTSPAVQRLDSSLQVQGDVGCSIPGQGTKIQLLWDN